MKVIQAKKFITVMIITIVILSLIGIIALQSRL